MGNWDPEWLQVVIAAGALIAAVSAWITSRQTYRMSYRPVIRPVSLGFGYTIPARSRFAVKNMGRGPAFGIVVVRERGSREADFAGECDALEPLGETYGPEHKESSRIGRFEIVLDRPFSHGDAFRILYQDLEGAWHETTFAIETATAVGVSYLRFKYAFAGEIQPEEVPGWIRDPLGIREWKRPESKPLGNSTPS